MKYIFPLISAAAALALSACGSNETAEVDNAANATNAAQEIELPPMVKESKSYRCTDDSIVYVDYMTDDKTANVRTEQNAMPTVLKSPEAGQPFTAEGYALETSGTGVKVTLPGKDAMTCTP